MQVVDRPPDAAEMLGAQRLLAGLPPETVDALVERLSWRHYRGGELVVRTGEASDGLGFVMAGRVRVLVNGTVIGEMGRGETLGETGPLTERPRNADVVTVRDTLVAWLDGAGFDAVVHEQPEIALRIAKHALARRPDELRGRGIASVVTLVSASPSLPAGTIAGELAAAPRTTGELTVIDDDVDERAAAARLHDAEEVGHQVLLPVDAGAGEAAAWRVRQADRVWVVVDGGDPASFRPGALHGVAGLLREVFADGVTPAVELVVVHPPSVDLPRRTRVLLAQLDVVGHHHVRRGDPAHLARLVRHLQGRSVNLVLSGGGARGHAHLGALRVLQAAGCPIDTTAGTSFGALMAAQIADGATADGLIERNSRWTAARVGTSFSYPPVVSLMSIRRAVAIFEELFGDRDLEDLWVPCSVAAVDISDGSLRIIDRGPLASMVRASGSPPGLWPPVPDDHGHLLVDGALVDNLPVLARRASTPGPVIAVDVSKTDTLTVDAVAGGVVNTREFLRSIRARAPFPTLPKLLMRSMTLSGMARLRESLDAADLVIQPDVSTITLAEHKRAAEAIAAGDRAAREALAAQPGLVERWR